MSSSSAEGHLLAFSGTLGSAEVAALAAQAPLMPLPSAATLILDLDEVEIEEGVAAAEWINLIRGLAVRVERLVLRAAPQLLAHTLYKTGMLEKGSNIVLSSPREEEGMGAG